MPENDKPEKLLSKGCVGCSSGREDVMEIYGVLGYNLIAEGSEFSRTLTPNSGGTGTMPGNEISVVGSPPQGTPPQPPPPPPPPPSGERGDGSMPKFPGSLRFEKASCVLVYNLMADPDALKGLSQAGKGATKAGKQPGPGAPPPPGGDPPTPPPPPPPSNPINCSICPWCCEPQQPPNS